MDYDDLTPEDVMKFRAFTHARIKAIEKKAIARLNMTDEEKQLFKHFCIIRDDPELKDLFITSLILGAKGETKSKSDKDNK